MEYGEICELLVFNEEYESKNFMPNEIFKELIMYVKKAPHIGFSYCYIYLCSWLYRHAKYTNARGIIDNKKIKEVLGYNPRSSSLDYLIKKGGLLDKFELLESTEDFPIHCELNEEGDLEFFMSSDMSKEELDIAYPNIPKNFFLKRPIKSLDDRTIEVEMKDEESGIFEKVELSLDGIFYDISHTHNIPFEVFVECISRKDVGCIGFYLYSFISHKCDIHEGRLDMSLVKMSEETGIPGTSLDRILMALREYGMVTGIVNLPDGFSLINTKEERMSNSYHVNSPDMFLKDRRKIKVRDVFTKEEYIEKKVMLNNSSEKIDFNVSELPY